MAGVVALAGCGPDSSEPEGRPASTAVVIVSGGDPVLPHRRCHTFDDTQSLYVPNRADPDWQTALTWDRQVFDVVHSRCGALDVVHSAIESAPQVLAGPNREGCPAT